MKVLIYLLILICVGVTLFVFFNIAIIIGVIRKANKLYKFKRWYPDLPDSKKTYIRDRVRVELAYIKQPKRLALNLLGWIGFAFVILLANLFI